jgi:hypothetical protein
VLFSKHSINQDLSGPTSVANLVLVQSIKSNQSLFCDTLGNIRGQPAIGKVCVNYVRNTRSQQLENEAFMSSVWAV